MTYAKNWAEVAARANEFIEFLQGDNFFSQPYLENEAYLVVTNIATALNYALDDNEENFSGWEDLFSTQFPENFDWELSLRINYNLTKNQHFGFFKSNLNGLLEKWTNKDSICIAEEMMMIHFDHIFNCYANDHFPPLWQEILNVYLNGGLPCGWSGHYPDGKMVVFSNY